MNYQRFREISDESFARINGVLSAETITILSSLIAATTSGDFYNTDRTPLTDEQSDELDAAISRAFYELRTGDEIRPETLYGTLNPAINPTTTGAAGTIGVTVYVAYPGHIHEIRWFKATNDNGGRNAYVFDVTTEAILASQPMNDGFGNVGWVSAVFDPPFEVGVGEYIFAVDQPGGAGYPFHYQSGYHNILRDNSLSLAMRSDAVIEQAPFTTAGLGQFPDSASAGIAFFVDIVYLRDIRT